METRLIATRGFANMHSICKVARGLTKYFLFGWLYAKKRASSPGNSFFFFEIIPWMIPNRIAVDRSAFWKYVVRVFQFFGVAEMSQSYRRK